MRRTRPDLTRWREFAETALWNEATAEWLVDDVSLPAIQGQQVSAVTPDAACIVPSNYEPRYPYPLIVWICGEGCDSPRALEHIANLSPQNYIGLAIEDELFREATPSPDARDVLVGLVKQLADIENRLLTAVRILRQSVHIHSERIYLAGVDSDASAALTVAMHQPDWFAGCIAFGGQLIPGSQLFTQKGKLVNKRFWLGASQTRRATSRMSAHPVARSLISAGADVTAKTYFGEQSVSSDMLRDVDEWIISGILAQRE